MSRCLVAEECHIVNILPPQSIAGAVNSDVFSMRDASHVSIIVTCGATDADAGNVTIEECDDFVPTNTTAIAFAAYSEETAAGDTLGSRTAKTTAGIDVSANNDITYVIEIDAEELTEGRPCLRLAWSAPGGATLVSAIAVLSGLAHKGDQTRTQIA